MVFFPNRRFYVNRRKASKIVISILTIIALVSYLHVFFTTGFEANDSGNEECVTLEKYFNFVKVSLLVDSIMSIILPVFLVAAFDSILALKIASLFNQIDAYQRDSVSTNSNVLLVNNMVDGALLENANNNNRGASLLEIIELDRIDGPATPYPSAPASPRSSNDSVVHRLSQYIASTRALFVISIVFLLLNSPLALCKLRYAVQAIENLAQASSGRKVSNAEKKAENEAHPFEEIVERITCYIYYLNFAVNFYIYRLCGYRSRLDKGFKFYWRKLLSVFGIY
jgi:hypothetical protein